MSKRKQIKELLATGMTQVEIAKKVGCAQPYVSAIKNSSKRAFFLRRGWAKRQKIEFTISFDDLDYPEFCPYLDIPIDYSTSKGQGGHDNYPSLDRINPNIGYVKGNVIVCSVKGNRIKNNATLDELETLVYNLRKIIS